MAQRSPGRIARVASTGGVRVASTGGVRVASTGGARVASTGGARVASTGGVRVASTGGLRVADADDTLIAALNRSRSSEKNCLSIRCETCSSRCDGTASTSRAESKTDYAVPAWQARPSAAASHPA